MVDPFYYALLAVMPFSILLLLAFAVIEHATSNPWMQRPEVAAVGLFALALATAMLWGLSLGT